MIVYFVQWEGYLMWIGGKTERSDERGRVSSTLESAGRGLCGLCELLRMAPGYVENWRLYVAHSPSQPAMFWRRVSYAWTVNEMISRDVVKKRMNFSSLSHMRRMTFANSHGSMTEVPSARRRQRAYSLRGLSTQPRPLKCPLRGRHHVIIVS